MAPPINSTAIPSDLALVIFTIQSLVFMPIEASECVTAPTQDSHLTNQLGDTAAVTNCKAWA